MYFSPLAPHCINSHLLVLIRHHLPTLGNQYLGSPTINTGLTLQSESCKRSSATGTCQGFRHQTIVLRSQYRQETTTLTILLGLLLAIALFKLATLFNKRCILERSCCQLKRRNFAQYVKNAPWVLVVSRSNPLPPARLSLDPVIKPTNFFANGCYSTS